MLWNWYTIDSCFIADTWHVRSAGGFAGSCIGVILLVTALEGLRRAQREFDRWLHHVELAKHVESSDGGSSSPRSEIAKGVAAVSTSYSGYPKGPAGRTLKAWQQLIRSVLYMLQFAVAYFVMLLAMYYNGTSGCHTKTLQLLVASLNPCRLYHYLHPHRSVSRCCFLSMGHIYLANVSKDAVW
jgi:solute carrier family 31 (copper transporter), member 1